jgi:hypothetical protein
MDLLPGAKADLRELRRSNPDALAAVMTFLQEAEADEKLIEKCTTSGDSVFGTSLVNIKPWRAQRCRSNNLFRFRILDTPATVYRIVYGFDWRSRRIGILAVVHKDDFHYAITGDLATRINDDWRHSTGGLPT